MDAGVPDSGHPPADAAGDQSSSTDGQDAAAGDGSQADARPPDQGPDSLQPDLKLTPPAVTPDQVGPYPVGVRTYTFNDTKRKRVMETRVWYPGVKPAAGAKKVSYFPYLLGGGAYPDLGLAGSGGPFPLVLFSHGNKGINYQSFSFTERLASHGFVVAAPSHAGNTMFDNPSDEQVAKIALERPEDIAFVHAGLVTINQQAGHPLKGAMDMGAVGISGHSFGGYTALVLAGAEVDVAAAAARCKAGTPAKIFCPYINYWPATKTITRPASMATIKAGLFMAPGGYAAFGSAGLKKIAIPTLIMGGSLDDLITLKEEVRPIFTDTGAVPRYKVEITGGGHMAFTDICRIPLSGLIPGLDAFCKPGKFIGIDKGHGVINATGVAFFRYTLKKEAAMALYLNKAWVTGKYSFADFESK